MFELILNGMFIYAGNQCESQSASVAYENDVCVYEWDLTHSRLMNSA